METGAAIREISREGPQKSKDRNTTGSSCITRVCPQRDVSHSRQILVHLSTTPNSRDADPAWMPNHGKWYISTTEFSLDTKNEVMSHAGKWREL